jgi:hypothetical protein
MFSQSRDNDRGRQMSWLGLTEFGSVRSKQARPSAVIARLVMRAAHTRPKCMDADGYWIAPTRQAENSALRRFGK